MSILEYNDGRNGHPVANLFGLLFLAAAAVTIIFKFLTAVKLIEPIHNISPFLLSGWMVVILSLLSLISLFVGIFVVDGGDQEDDEGADSWFVLVTFASLATFVISLVYMLVYVIFFLERQRVGLEKWPGLFGAAAFFLSKVIIYICLHKLGMSCSLLSA